MFWRKKLCWVVISIYFIFFAKWERGFLVWIHRLHITWQQWIILCVPHGPCWNYRLEMVPLKWGQRSWGTRLLKRSVVVVALQRISMHLSKTWVNSAQFPPCVSEIRQKSRTTPFVPQFMANYIYTIYDLCTITESILNSLFIGSAGCQNCILSCKRVQYSLQSFIIKNHRKREFLRFIICFCSSAAHYLHF